MSVFNPILPMRQAFYQRAHWTQEAAFYVNAEGIDLDEVNAHAGVIAALPLAFHHNGLFDFSGGNTLGIVIEVYGEDDESTVDLCAWPIDNPRAFATAIGSASVLGAAQIANPASWAFGSCLKVHRTPLEWLKDKCQGIVVLDFAFAGYELGQALGPLLAQDERHAADLRRFLCKAPLDPKQILYPPNTISKAA